MSNVIDIPERIADLVTNIPPDTVAMHGGSDSLEVKILDLIFPLQDNTPKKRGRPKGSKNKPKDAPQEVPAKPKNRGRPKGSKNKVKDSHVPSKESTAAAVIQRAWRASRPNHPICGNRCVYGCCNKKNVDFLGSLVRDAPPSTEVAKTPKKRGRPKGSKNKVTDTPLEVPPAPKKRGRPKGSKNKSQ